MRHYEERAAELSTASIMELAPMSAKRSADWQEASPGVAPGRPGETRRKARTTAQKATAPAFRSGGRHSLTLSTEELREVMKSSAGRVLGEDWEFFDYGMHSLRIGRENNLRHADVRADLLNDITSHTSDQGRRSYSRAETEELIKASRAADSAVSAPLEKSVHFGSDPLADRSSARAAVGGIKRDGRVIDIEGTSL